MLFVGFPTVTPVSCLETNETIGKPLYRQQLFKRTNPLSITPTDVGK